MAALSLPAAEVLNSTLFARFALTHTHRAVARSHIALGWPLHNDTEGNEGYLIIDALPGLIKAGKSPTMRLLGSDGRELA